MEERILRLHPDPIKAGVNISKEKYDQIRDAILGVLTDKGELSLWTCRAKLKKF